MADLFKKLFGSSSKTKDSTSANVTPSATSTSQARGDSAVNLNLITSPIVEGYQIGIQSERKERCIARGITALELLKEISEASGVLAPLKAICGVILAVLNTIEAMDSNQEAWKDVVDTIHTHHGVFEQQLDSPNLEQMSRDLDPKLLAAIQIYARNLSGILAAAMLEHGISRQTLPNKTRFQRLIKFMKDYGTARMDGDRITGHLKRLDEAMKHFNTSIGLHIAVKVDAMDQTVQRIEAKLSTVNLESGSAEVTGLKPRPPLVKNFVGREDILEAMRRTHLTERSTKSQDPAITVLSGLGGAGKTQVALKFALEFEDKRPNAPVYFVNASAEETLRVDFENIIRSRGTKYRSASHQDALAWLATGPDDWLMIMDGADDPSFRLLPYIALASHGNVIITTRNANQAMLAPNSSHHLEGLSTEDAIILILTASGNEDTAANRALARTIVEVLGHLPLALAQAAGYILVHKCLSTYIVLFRRSGENLLATRLTELPYDYPSSVAMTIQMSLDQLPIHALDTLSLFSHLDSTLIPHAIIYRAANRKFRRVEWTEERDLSIETRGQAEALIKIFCSNRKWSEVKFNDLIRCCLQYSLLRLTTQGNYNFYSMHTLVRSYLRAKIHLIQGHQPGQLVVRLLGSSFTFSTDYKHLAFSRLLLPHLRQIRMEDVVEAGDHAGFGHVMERAGENKLAVLHLKQCMEMWRESLGDEHRNTLAAMANLAISYMMIGNFQKALELERKVLDVKSATLGPEHHETLMTAGNLATSYSKLGRHNEAAKLKEQVLKAQRRVLGPEDSRTVRTMANLAVSYKYLGLNQKALELEEQVVEIQRKILGPEDPDTLVVMSNLANSYHIMGRKQAALKLNQQALDMQKSVLGDEHPQTLYSILVRLEILRDLGMMEQLRQLLRIALPNHEKALGSDHPDTLWIRKEFRRELALL